WNSRRIAVRYESWKGEVARTLEPLGLILKGGLWYLAARPAEGRGREPRTYRVSNILELTLVEDTFERPAAFDLAAWWAETSRRFEAEIFTGTATLRLTAEGLRRLARLGAEQARIAAGARPGADGRVEVVVPIESVEHASTDFLRLGAEAEVLAPSALRDAMAAAARRLAALYA
ncbi:MAG: WYL domain-containing protein, partial [Alphaproteobacteria bacterium]|nr:WYL domain-containing protein [Alphaproteobacteria bacterium]MBU4040221.1 WYL domain-containing protein [Alphaproteobacteria bacterium]